MSHTVFQIPSYVNRPQGSTIEFTDILVGSTLPLHPYLINHPRLSIRLIVDGNEIDSSLRASVVRQSITFAVVATVSVSANPKALKFQFTSATFSLADVVKRVKACPHGHLEFSIGDTFSSIPFLLTCSVKIASQNISESPSSQANVQRLVILGGSLYDRFIRLGSIEDLGKAIESFQTVVELTPDGHPQQAGRLNNLGRVLQCRFECLGGFQDLEKAILSEQKALELMPDSHPDKALTLSNLGNSLHNRFACLGTSEDIEKSIAYHNRAVELTPDGDLDKPSNLNNLGNALRSRFERFGRLEDVEKAIWSQQKAVELLPNGQPDELRLLTNLGITLQSHFERLGGSLEYIERAISVVQKAVRLTPEGHPDRACQFNILGGAHKSRFEWLGGLKDMERAIISLQKAVELTPNGHHEKPGRLSNLGGAFECRFERLGGVKDLEEAILLKQKAVDLLPDGHPDKPGQLDHLGNIFQLRFNRLGSVKDLDKAIASQQKSLGLTPDGHPDTPGRLTNLGCALQSRFGRLGGVKDLEDVILTKQKAVELTSDSNPGKPRLLSNLGNSHRARFSLLGNIEDVEKAISSHRKGVELTPDGHPDEPLYLTNLGNTLQSHFMRLGRLDYLERAISSLQKAVELTPDDHPEKTIRFESLGKAFLQRFESFRINQDLESALFALSSAAHFTTGAPMVRFQAARLWAKVAEQYDRSSLEAYNCAVELLPRIAWLRLPVTDQHALLADAGGLVRDAVAAAIMHEEYETAVVWAEQGRSIVWKNLLGLPSQVDDLRATRPDLADRLQSTARQLETSESRDVGLNKVPTAPTQDIPRRYSQLALEWESIVEEIRRIPKFEGFLKAKTFDQLAPAAYEGPVIILNVTSLRSDALLLIADDSEERHVFALNITLERFSHETSKKLFHNLTKLLSSAGLSDRDVRKSGRAQYKADNEAKFKAILSTLWRDVVQPVMKVWRSSLKRHNLPVFGGNQLSDYVISSYTPTLTAILDTSDPVVQNDFQVLTVAQPSVPWAPDIGCIPMTEDEVQIIKRLATGARVVSLTKKDATVQRQSREDPMNSGFLLYDKMLKLSEIIKVSLPKADFAFLSACQTAVGDEKISEEWAHLAAGMLLSGCRGVIATTWSIRDEDGPKIAEMFIVGFSKMGSLTERKQPTLYMKL